LTSPAIPHVCSAFVHVSTSFAPSSSVFPAPFKRFENAAGSSRIFARRPIFPAVGAFDAISSGSIAPFHATTPLIDPGLPIAVFSATSAPMPSPAITTRFLSIGWSFLNAAIASVTGFSNDQYRAL
jgi:hypothetical protein